MVREPPLYSVKNVFCISRGVEWQAHLTFMSGAYGSCEIATPRKPLDFVMSLSRASWSSIQPYKWIVVAQRTFVHRGTVQLVRLVNACHQRRVEASSEAGRSGQDKIRGVLGAAS